MVVAAGEPLVPTTWGGRGNAACGVVVVSPMSAVRHLPVVDDPLRWAHHRRLMTEVRRLEAGGTTVVRFEPDARCVAAMGRQRHGI